MSNIVNFPKLGEQPRSVAEVVTLEDVRSCVQASVDEIGLHAFAHAYTARGEAGCALEALAA